MRKPWAQALSVGLLLAVPVALLLPALAMGKLVLGWDVMTLGQPMQRQLELCLAAHQWPLWMPGAFGGMPFLASCNTFFSYPTAMAGALAGLSLGTTLAWDSALHLALAGLGMFLLLRRLDRSLQASLLGALCFQVSGSQLSPLNGGFQNFVEGMALLPWVFWAAHKALKEGSWFAWGLCGLAMGLQLLAVAAQLFAYTLAALLWFLAAEARAEAPVGGRWRALQPVALGLAAALGLAFLIAAPQLWPTLQYLPFCERNGYSHAQFVDGSISLRECLAWVVPGYFGWQEPTYDGPMSVRFTTEYLGLLPLALAAAALAGLWARERRVRWLAWLSLAALFLAQREWTPFEWAIQHLPVLRGFRFWSRILFLDTFAVCALAAYGWDQLRDGPGRRRAWAGALAFVGLAVALATAAWALAAHRVGADRSVLHGMLAGTQPRFTAETIGMAQDSARATLWLLPPLLGVLWAATRRWPRGLALALALALMAKDQGQVARRFIRFGEPEPPALQGRMAGPAPAPAGLEPYRVADAEGLACNRLMVMGYESLVGFSSMKMDSFLRINQAMQNRPQEWMDLYNVRYRVLPSGPDPSVMRFEGNPHAYPRAWLVSRSQAVSGDAEAYARLADPAFDPRSDVLLAQDLGLPGGRPQGTVTWLARSPAGESLDVATDRAAALVLSNAWYPSWRCRVDGVDRPVLKADGGLQAVALGAGRHRLDFRFDPGLYQAALAASLAGLLLLLGLGLWRPRLAPADGARP